MIIAVIVLHVLLSMETGGLSACRRMGGFCQIGFCRYPTRPIEKCSHLGVETLKLASSTWPSLLAPGPIS
uniref:Beta-defensin-like domain-containing protein n=1 Tax=Cyanoderma ruficeps TaxID=181631 RepID=A0A8C3P2G3_9PASS